MRLQQLRPLSERLPLLSRPRSAWCLLFDFLLAFVLQTRSSRCCLVRLPGEKNEIKTFQAGGHCALFKSPHPPSGVGPPHEGTRSHGTGVSAGPGLDPWPVCGCPPGRGVGDVPSRRGFIPKASSPRAGRPGSRRRCRLEEEAASSAPRWPEGPPPESGPISCIRLRSVVAPAAASRVLRVSFPRPGEGSPQPASERATCRISEFITSPSVSTPNRANGVPTALKVTRPGAGQPQLSFPVLRSVLPPALCGLWGGGSHPGLLGGSHPGLPCSDYETETPPSPL